MLHLFPQAAADDAPLAYPEAVSRLASVRHALRLVEPFASGPASDFPNDADVAAAFESAGPARQRSFDRRSAAMVGAAAHGLEALLAERQEGREPSKAAGQALIDEIRRELRDVAGIVLS